jgi:alkaline phosphatase D
MPCLNNTLRRWGFWPFLASSLTVSIDASLAGETASVYVQSGDVNAESAVVWARCTREQDARLAVEFATSPAFDDDYEEDEDDDFYDEDDANDIEDDADRYFKRGPQVSAETDYTGSVRLRGLEPNETYYYRVACVAKNRGHRNKGHRVVDVSPVGRFRTAPEKKQTKPLRFVWVADLAGQGWGRNPQLEIVDENGDLIQGGYVIFDVISQLEPDYAIFAGDIIYADNPIEPTKAIPEELGGGTWINDPTKDFVALSLDDYRENWRYNLGDSKLREFLLDTPMYIQWDDHEVTNNWYPGEVLTSDPYNGRLADDLAELSRRAMFEYNPIAGQRIYRSFRFGEHLELFLLDERSFRGPNPHNDQAEGIEMLGAKQLQWLKRGLQGSRATWKIVSTHDPLSIVTGGPGDWDAWAQGDAQVLGREVQLRELLQFIKAEEIENLVFITADVHYAAVFSYHPEEAQFADFTPFKEFVIGPVHAGAFGTNAVDSSFGPQTEFLRAPSTEGLPQNAPPPYLQSFGAFEVSRQGELTVRIHDITGEILYEEQLQPK